MAAAMRTERDRGGRSRPVIRVEDNVGLVRMVAVGVERSVFCTRERKEDLRTPGFLATGTKLTSVRGPTF